MAAGEPVSQRLAVRRDADHAEHRPEREADPLVHPDRVALDLEDGRDGRLDPLAQLADPGNQRREAARLGAERHDLGHERVSRLGAAHGDRPGRAVHAGEVDLGHEVLLGPNLAGEAVVRLEGHNRPGLDLEHGLQIGTERPHDVVPGKTVVSRDRQRQSSSPIKHLADPGDKPADRERAAVRSRAAADRAQRGRPSSIVRTTFPLFWPVSTYLVASTMSSRR